MGPNGAGKSTLSNVLAGKAVYEITKGEIIFDGKDIDDLSISERAAAGIFLSLQYPENVVIRSDNGSQFIANSVREYLGLIGVQQEFTHVATPEENAHIEAYHGILKKEVFQRVDYRTFGEIEQILKRYVIFYNNTRLHGLLGRITPMEKWNQDKHLILMNKLTA
jgi:putative transposase